jgi:hypothetical protein
LEKGASDAYNSGNFMRAAILVQIVETARSAGLMGFRLQVIEAESAIDIEQAFAGLRRTQLRHGPSSIANETVFEPHGLKRELRSLVHQKAGMTLFWSEVLGSFPEGLALPAGTEAAVPADPGAGERPGCES